MCSALKQCSRLYRKLSMIDCMKNFLNLDSLFDARFKCLNWVNRKTGGGMRFEKLYQAISTPQSLPLLNSYWKVCSNKCLILSYCLCKHINQTNWGMMIYVWADNYLVQLLRYIHEIFFVIVWKILNIHSLRGVPWKMKRESDLRMKKVQFFTIFD